jgi:hypothetical protein
VAANKLTIYETTYVTVETCETETNSQKDKHHYRMAYTARNIANGKLTYD